MTRWNNASARLRCPSLKAVTCGSPAKQAENTLPCSSTPQITRRQYAGILRLRFTESLGTLSGSHAHSHHLLLLLLLSALLANLLNLFLWNDDCRRDTGHLSECINGLIHVEFVQRFRFGLCQLANEADGG
ncbi:Uncharacterised protein [Klebsiella pneumoniae]|nr:Uncharacterised protein [Klebsiella pneumoniae]